MIATLLQTAKMNNIYPRAWLTLTLERFTNGWLSSSLEALMPLVKQAVRPQLAASYTALPLSDEVARLANQTVELLQCNNLPKKGVAARLTIR